MGLKKKNRGIVFSLDAAAAFLLLASLAAALLLFSFSTTAPATVHESLHAKAGDSVSVLARVHVYDVRREPPIMHLFDSNVLSESALNESVIQLVADLWASGDPVNLTRAQNITEYFLSRFYGSNVNFALYASNESISNRTPSGEYTVASASRSFVSGISSTRNIAKGCVARAFVQKIRGKAEIALAYFGGFEGQGNMTVVVSVPSRANITEVSFEANAGTNFTLFLNGVECGKLNHTGTLYHVDKWVFNSTQGVACLSAAKNGSDNIFEMNFTGANLTPNYFGGGLAKITFETDELTPTSSSTLRHYFNGVDGVINYYSSFYVPGNVTQMSGQLHLLNNYTTFLVVGNKTIFEDNGTNETRFINLTNSNFSAAFPDFTEISVKTIPLRLGVKANFTGGRGNADVVLITDLSGSMNYRMDSDNSGVIRNCTDPLLYNASTQRLSVAKCIDKEFVNIIIGAGGNRMALVSFSTDLSNYTAFLTNGTSLNSTIESYNQGGWTCIACSINKAFELLREFSNSSRKKYVIVMSDGVANRRANGGCAFNDAESATGTDFACEDEGGFSHYESANTSNWTDYYSGVANEINSIAAENESFAFAVGASSKLFKWNGAAWSQNASLGSYILYGIDLLNATLGYAVGASGKIYKWNGAAWAQDNDTGSNVFYGVSVFNSTLAFAVGDGGLIYKWNGAAWSQNASLGSYTLYDVKFVNGSWAFAVGTEGKIYRWAGGNWAQYQDTGSQTWHGLSIVNSTTVFVAGSGGAIYKWTAGSTFASFSSPTSQQINGIVFRNDSTGMIATSNMLVYSYASGAWTLARDGRYTGTLTTGTDCNDDDSCTTAFSNNFAAQNANYSSCRLFNKIDNATVDSVGFGPVDTCALANTTLYAIAQCGNGSYFASQNASQLADFYRNLANAIVKQANASQMVITTGDVRSILYADSYIDFQFTPQTQFPYQALSLSKTASLASCQGELHIPPALRVYDVRVTSYSADRWTSNVSVYNSGAWKNAFNLAAYNQTSFLRIGDPFLVQLNPESIAQGASNIIDVRTAFSPGNQSPDCSTDNTVLYKGWVNSSVGYGSLFPNCTARNVTVYYDLNGDNAQDGFAHVLVGGNASENAIPVELLNQNHSNGIEDAFLRLLSQLDLNPAGGVAGSQQNPIDVALSREVSSNFIETLGLPALNSTAFSVVLWQ